MENRNVLLITIDSLRYDYFGSEHDGVFSPRIAELASEGVWFNQAIANGPNTRTSFPSILTSTYPIHYGGYSFLSDERPFVAQEFNNAGYETVGYHSNPHLGRDQNYDTGFETFNDEAEASESISTLKDRVERRLNPDSRIYSLLRRLWHRFSMSTGSTAYAKADTISDNGIEWLETYDEEDPFFMWLHYMDVHYPFMPPEEHLRELGVEPLSDRRVAELNGKMQEQPGELTERDREDLLNLYQGEIRYVDSQIARVLDELESRGLSDDTIVVVTADHGEAFGEHDRYGHEPCLYDELLRVPLVINVPGRDRERIDHQVSLLDLGPTLLSLSDIGVPTEMDGESVFNDTGERTAISVASSGEIVSTRTHKWKCIWRVSKGEIELYDLESDPAETTNVKEDHPSVVDEFRERLKSHREAARQTDTDLPEVDKSVETKQRLRDLGYLE